MCSQWAATGIGHQQRAPKLSRTSSVQLLIQSPSFGVQSCCYSVTSLCQGLKLHQWLVEAADGKRHMHWDAHSPAELSVLWRVGKEEAQEGISRGHQIHSLVPWQESRLPGLPWPASPAGECKQDLKTARFISMRCYNSAHMLCVLLNFLKCFLIEENGFPKPCS